VVRFGADLALVSLNEANYNGVENVSRGDRVPFVINGPGEYEVNDVFIKGWGTPGSEGKINTVYSLVLDGIKLVHLGAIASPELPAVATEGLGAVDIVFVPVGGILEPKQTAKLAADLEAKLIIPIEAGDEAKLKLFLKELGAEGSKPVESLAVKRKDLLEKEGQVVMINSN
jgi:L-ascorbate metabolism protein UlaG (beta-lactamase superfamily)